MNQEMDNLLPTEDGTNEIDKITPTDLTSEESHPELSQADYSELSIEQLTQELQQLLQNSPVTAVKNQVQALREEFMKKVEAEKEAQKAKFLAEGGDILDFQYQNIHSKPFEQLISDYRNKVKAVFAQNEGQMKENLKKRLTIIEELKDLYQNPNADHHHTFKKFKEIKERWNNAGMIPKAHATTVFNNYHHHLDNYYEYLQFNRGLQELEFKTNLEQKNALIERARQLIGEENLQKAFNELQFLHKVWKEIGPVAQGVREEKWNEFKEVTKQVHDRKQELTAQIETALQHNLERKNVVILKVKEITSNLPKSHQQWHDKIKVLEDYRQEFMKIGRVPKEINNAVWDEFKELLRDFNHQKNEFYKGLKNEQNANLEKKLELLDKAKSLKDSPDLEKSHKAFVDIQAKWKKIGHVPKKYSDKIWNEFKDTCNAFFDRYHNIEKEKNASFQQNYENKAAYLAKLQKEKLPTDVDAISEALNKYNAEWKALGMVPREHMNINDEFHKTIENLMKSTKLTPEAIDDIKMNNVVNHIIDAKDEAKLEHEIREARKKMQDLEHEIMQLENNMGFFSNAKADNPLLKNAQERIEKLKEQYQYWNKRYHKLIKIEF